MVCSRPFSSSALAGQALGVRPDGEGEKQGGEGGVPSHRADVLPQPERDGEKTRLG